MKRWIAVLCCAALLLCVFSGCGGSSASGAADSASAAGSDETVSAQEAPAAQTAAAPAAVSADEGPVEPAMEQPEGNEPMAAFPNADSAVLLFSNVYELPLTEETETFTMMRTAVSLMGPLASVGIQSFDEMGYIQEIEQRTNVHLDLTEVTHDTQVESMQLAIATGDYPDFMCGMSYATGDEGALADDVIYDLTDMLEEYSPNYHYMINSNEKHSLEFKSDGKVLKYMSPYDQYVANQGLVIRQDWLDELGLEVPGTYDALTEVLNAFHDAYSCSQTIYMNTQCYITSLSDGYDVAAFVADGGASTEMPYYVDNGQVRCSLNSDGYREYLTMLNDWYESGLIDPDFVSTAYNPFTISEPIEADQMGVWCTSGEGIDNYTPEITCLPSMVKAEGDMDHIFTMSLVADSQNDTYITTGCENLELAMQWMDYWYSADGILFSNYGIEGQSYEIGEDGMPAFTDAVINNDYDVSVSNMMRLECGYGVFSTAMIRYRTASFNSELGTEAWETWSSRLDGSMVMPDYISLDSDQAQSEGYYTSDILTYAEQMVPQFITGALDIDKEWDSYCENLESMSIDECISIWQEAYDSVMG